MPRQFDVPDFYRSEHVQTVKLSRKSADPRKKDRSPSILDFGVVRFKLARHFGFCFGVENAIEIAYKVLEENPDKRIFLLSEIIHNPGVNKDLHERGIRFLMKPDGTRLVDFSTLSKEDVVVVPAFGTTIELQRELESLGIDPYRYDATCPFVEKVWKRSAELGNKEFSIIIHGKRTHEETRATFSHSKEKAPTLVVLDKADASVAIQYILGEISLEEFRQHFKDCMSEDFEPEHHLQRIGVVNQTTMLASETKEIAQMFRQAMITRYGEENIAQHFADTRDTLCYATYENQSATVELRDSGADLALVVGGYNSSNTSHLVELCEESFPTYYIKDAEEILSENEIRHFDMHSRNIECSLDWLPKGKEKLTIAVTAGASCPDSTVDKVLQKLLTFFPDAGNLSEAVEQHRVALSP